MEAFLVRRNLFKGAWKLKQPIWSMLFQSDDRFGVSTVSGRGFELINVESEWFSVQMQGCSFWSSLFRACTWHRFLGMNGILIHISSNVFRLLCVTLPRGQWTKKGTSYSRCPNLNEKE